MRRAARTDQNQPSIVRALRGVGASVTPTAAVGAGFPDLVVGWRGITYLLEVKDPTKPKRDQRLTPAQVKWHGAWRGHATVVKTDREALYAIGAASAPD